MDDDEEDLINGTRLFVLFLIARLKCGLELLEMCEVFERMPGRRGATYRRLMKNMEDGVELVGDTMSEEMQA